MAKARVVLLSLLLVGTPALFAASALAAPAAAEERFVVGVRRATGLEPGDRFHGGRVLAVDEPLGFVTVSAEPRDFRVRAGRDANVRYLEADPLLPLLLASPDDPRYGSQYGPQKVRANEAWGITMGSTDASVCIVDTGVRYTHEDLAGARWRGGTDLHNRDSDPWDDNGHGTHVAGIAAAGLGNGKGIAGLGNVAVYGVKVLSAFGSGFLSTVASGIRWCADNAGPRVVISLSLGGSGTDSSLQDAVRYAWNQGALVVAAAGNSGPCNNCILYPARYAEAIAVTCTDANDAQCSFSSDGPEADLAAPGSGILAPYAGSDADYRTMSGTSMSTPHVSGVAALVWSRATSLNNSALRSILECSAKDLGAGGWDEQFGHGRVDAKRALDLALAGSCSGTPPPPPPPPPPGTPDLVVSEVQVPAQPSAGQSLTFTAVVRNQGNADAGGFAVAFALDGAALGQRSVAGLAAGSSVSLGSDAWTATEGSHTARATADALGQVAESDEANNGRDASFSVAPPPPPPPPPPPAQPDLTVTEARVSVINGDGTFSGTVKNQGSGSAAAFVVRFVLDNATFEERSVAGLEPGASVSLTTGTWRATSGTHTLRIVADAKQELAESDEANNERSLTFTVSGGDPPPPPPGGKPDLVVSALDARSVGRDVTFTATVKNQGTANSGSFAVRFQRDGLTLQDRLVAGLAPGQTATVSSGPWRTSAGVHSLRAIVDPQGFVAESNESNNARDLTFVLF